MRVAVIGCGAIGTWHARIVAEHAAGTLAAVCDTDGDKARSLAESLGTRAFVDAGHMLAETPLDALIVATTEDSHVALAALAAQHGCGVLIEKPVAADLDGIAAIERAAAAHGITVMAAHVERFETGYAHLRDAVAQGVCGRVVSVAARRRFGPAQAPRFAGRSTTLRLLAVHDFDLIAWVHPATPTEVYAVAGRGAIHAACGMDDCVSVTVRFADGAVGRVDSAWTLPPAYERFAAPQGWAPSGDNLLEVVGDRGVIANDVSLRNQQLTLYDTGHGFRADDTRHQPVLHGRVVGALRDEVDHFLACVRDGSRPLVGLADARRSIALVQAAERSLAEARPVPVDGWA
ncbi:MAG: Gfo/Idh/MocA family oxidoreductase [Alphaproteobacteria bacterium]